MATLIGYDGTGWTALDETLAGDSGWDPYMQFTAAASGTATSAKFYVTDWASNTSSSVAVYESGSLVAESDTVSSAAGTGLKSATIDCSIVEGHTYFLVLMVATGYPGIRKNSASGGWNYEYKAIGIPGSAPSTATLSGGSSGSYAKEFIIYLDGTTGDGATEITAGAGALTASGKTPVLDYGMPLSAGTLTVAGNAPTFIERGLRYSYPTADVTDGTWLPSTGTDLYAAIDEDPASDTDYIYTNAAGACQIRLLPVTDPVSSSGYAVNYRIWSPVGGNAVVRLKQGTTTIAEWTHTGLPTSPTAYSQSLSAGEADSITDHDDLRIEIEAT